MALTITQPRTRLLNGFIDPAMARCHCGSEICLADALDNTCDDCGRTYNMSGQEVTPSWQCDAQGNPYDND